MRFEAKHGYFKQWASKLNLKNVCKSLANHNRVLECCQNEGMQHPIFANERELGPVLDVSNVDYVKAKLRDFLCIDVIKSGISVKWMIIQMTL